MVFTRMFVAAALIVAAGPLTAQVVFQPLAVSDADALAEQVRRLGTRPLDLDALLSAGELSLRLDDLNAAGAFFARAEKIDPRNPRAKAGEGALLVRSERPGEALRLFAQAEAMGFAPARFAADRGLAFDLVGDQARAQRDYREALAARADDETRRRYALSLAISGKQAQALDLLAPLIRQNDRAAWRSRAFILAMGGNSAEASRIAQTMMPPGSATGLQDFFAELPRLSAIDRAFAVHFGEVHATAARLADARLAPVASPLPVETTPVQVAVVNPPIERGQARRRDRRAPVTAAKALPPPVVEVAALPPAYQPQLSGTAAAPATDRPLTQGELASLAAAGLRSSPRSAARRVPTPGFSAMVAPRVLTPAEQANRAVAFAPVQRADTVIARPVVPPTAVAAVVTKPAVDAVVPKSVVGRMPMPAEGDTISARRGDVGLAAIPVTPPATAPTTLSLAPPPLVAAAPITATLVTPKVASAPPVTAPMSTPVVPVADVEEPPVPVASSAATAEAVTITPVLTPVLPRLTSARPARSTRLGRAEADSILARIVANLAIPAAELGVQGALATGTRPQPVAERRRARKADEGSDQLGAADRKLLATRKASADKKVLADKLAAKELADARKASRAEPGRIWVQVAGGANEGDLDKAWSAVRSKAPAAFAGKRAWTTPLRATNRVLTGPFKTDAEARAYVNSLAKTGVSAFTFTSGAGQKVSPLPGR